MSLDRSKVHVFTAQKQLEGGGFEVTRPFPSMALPDMDPFLLLDQMGPKDIAPGKGVGAPDHPHRGFETVTYMLSGEMEHKDSHGNHGVIGPGDVQWMTAGAGVIDSEMPTDAFQQTGGLSHGVQLWVNLPAKDKMMQPRYQDLTADDTPIVDVPGAKVRIISGTFQGTQARIDTVIPIQYLHVTLEPGASLAATVPEGHNGFVYALLDSGAVHGEAVTAGQIALVPVGDVPIQAGPQGLDALVLSGPPLQEPVARYGPFVMNTRQEIVQAVRDFQEGRFGEIAPDVGGGKAYLPGPGVAPE